MALPSKGSLSLPTRKLFAAAGFEGLAESRSYSLNGKSLSFLLVRAKDVPLYLERELADIGVTGKDVLAETGTGFASLLDLPYGYCRLSLAAPVEARGRKEAYSRIATAFPNLARQYCRRRGLQSEIIVLEGAVEASVSSGIADAIVDLVSTGKTLQANNLQEKEVLLQSNAVLVASPLALKEKKAEVERLVAQLKGNWHILRSEIAGLSPEQRRKLLRRGREQSGEVLSVVREIISRVEQERDAAISFYSQKFGGVSLKAREFEVPGEAIREAYAKTPPVLLEALKQAAFNIRRFAEKELRESFEIKMDGGFAGKRFVPLDCVGVYAPGGMASYPSSVLMGVIPAKVAGVRKIVVCTPCNSIKECNPAVLVAADLAGADEVYRLGGAQAIAALALGTGTVPRVRKIVGPGNVYVAGAKLEVQARGFCAIDMPAGPSEILVVADETANPAWVAADLLAQAEHDADACPVLVTTSQKIAGDVEAELRKQAMLLSRRQIVEKALQNNGAILLAKDLVEALEFANAYAPEHLELQVERPGRWLDKVRNAGAVFLGSYACEAAGDYSAGPNHVLPTGGSAGSYSGLSVSAFGRELNYLMLQRSGLEKLRSSIKAIADAEGLEAHANSVKKRFEGEGK